MVMKKPTKRANKKQIKPVKNKRVKSAVKKPAKGFSVAELKKLRRLIAKADDSAVRIETPRLKGGGRKIKNTSRPFWTDGMHAYLRRRQANPAIIERTDAKVRKGEYKHARTSDDVEVYEIAEWSPLRRKKLNLSEMSLTAVERHIVRAACAHDYRLYYDAVSEYAHRIKNSDLPQVTAELMLQTQMRYLEYRIMRRGGPTPMMIHHELSNVRKQRTGTQFFLPH